jgi:hypothetical protein
VLSLAGPAQAAAPSVEVVTLRRQFEPYGSCDGFNVIGDFDLVRRQTTFYSQDGMSVRFTVHVTFGGTVSNSVTGKSIPVTGVGYQTIDLITGERSTRGSSWHMVVPGTGTVELAAGHIVFDAAMNLIIAAGRLDGQVNAELCDALS